MIDLLTSTGLGSSLMLAAGVGVIIRIIWSGRSR